MILMNNWVENTALYPPAHIYAGKPQGKQEKNAVRICEELYKFNHGNKPNVLGELRSAWRDVVVTSIMNANYDVKIEYIDKVQGTFLFWALIANRELQKLCKQHPDLAGWYKPWALKNQEIKSYLYDCYPDTNSFQNVITVHDALALEWKDL